MTTQERRIGERIGQAIARDVLAEDMPREWTGLDPQDADQIPPECDPDEVESEARKAYEAAIAASLGRNKKGKVVEL